MTKDIAVLGAGSWGTALAIQAAKAGGEVLLWSRKPEVVDAINRHHINHLHLANIPLPHNIKATDDLAKVARHENIVIATPAQSTRSVLGLLSADKRHSFVIASKGVENRSLKLMSEVVLDLMPNSEISILSGPNFAREVAVNLPTVTTIASANQDLLDRLTRIFTSPNFKIHHNQDIIGTQICGASKNVIAIACGICLGGQLGENARAAVLTKGIDEIRRLITILGGDKETVLTPAGIGDLSLTCSSPTSRNMLYGIELATGKSKHDKLTEGFYAAKSIDGLAKKHGLDLQLISALSRIIDKPTSAIDEISKVCL